MDLAPARGQVEAQSAQWRQKLAELEKKLAEPPKDDRAKFAELAAQLEKEAKFNDVDRHRDFPPGDASLREKCGGYLLAISRPLSNGGESLFKAGTAMKSSGTANKADAETVKTAVAAVDDAVRMLTTNEEKKTYGAALKSLRKLLALLQLNTAESKAAQAAEIQETKKMVDSLNAKISQSHPLSGEGIPPGAYQIFARDAGTDLLLLELQIP